MLSGTNLYFSACCMYVGVDDAPVVYRSRARSRFPRLVRNMASMTSLKYVLDPFSPLNGDVTERWRAEPTVGKISVCF